MQYKITIPNPCLESWDAMLPEETGRYCNRCATSVIDFTGMSDEEIKNFFIRTGGQPVCGRFNRQQLHRVVLELPEYIFRLRIPHWMRFLVASLLVFGLSLFPFETTIAGMKPSESGYYQGEPRVLIQKEKRKKSKKRKKRWYEVSLKNPNVLTSGTISGFTITEPFPDANRHPLIHAELPAQNDSQLRIARNRPAPEDEHAKNEQPPERKQPSQTEFILPAALAPLKRKKK